MHNEDYDYDIQLTVEQQLYDEVQRLKMQLFYSERKNTNLRRRNRELEGIRKKQDKRLQQLSGRKDPYFNEPANKRRKGKKR